MVVARHLRDDATEFARLRSRFQETYLLLEVCEEDEDFMNGINENSWKDELDLPMNNTVAFVLVPLVDDVALLTLFTTQATHLQFVGRGAGTERLPAEEFQIVRISILNFEANRVMKLAERYLDEDFVHGAQCFPSSLEQYITVAPIFEEIVASEGKDMKSAATVRLSVEAFDGYRPELFTQFSLVLELWKFLEICLAGEST